MKNQNDDIKKSFNPQAKNDSFFSSVKRWHFEKIDSTNTWAKAHQQEWIADGVTVVTASTQTDGRGRAHRKWISPQGNLYVSFCFWISLENKGVHQIPLLLGLACVKVLERLGFFPKIKWPNDLLVGEKKLAGILCETVQEERERGVICGLGLNINMRKEELKSLERPATSLWIESEKEFDPEKILQMIVSVFVEYLNRFIKEGFSPFFPFFEAKFFFTRGQKVCLHHGQELLEGWFERLYPDGSIELQFKKGGSKRVYSGEVNAN